METCKTIFYSDPEQEFRTDEGCHILELLNCSDDPDVSIARARVQPGETTAWHYLKKSVERYVLLEGWGLVEVGDMEPSRVGPGSVVLIPAGCRQRITCLGDSELVFLCICSPRFTPEDYVALP